MSHSQGRLSVQVQKTSFKVLMFKKLSLLGSEPSQ